MTLKAKIFVSITIGGLLVAATSVLLLLSSRQVTETSKNAERTVVIVDTISQIRFSTFEHMLHRNQSSFEQWKIKHDSLLALLQPTADASAEQIAALQTIGLLSKETEPLFNRLAESYALPLSVQQTAAERDLQELLGGQILIRQQKQIIEALTLQYGALDTVSHVNQNASMFVVAAAVLMVIMIIGNYLLFTHTVGPGLKKLQEGADKIATGDFDYRIKTVRNSRDEFSGVASAFNRMAAATGEVDKIKSEFILLASHQLRTPLTAVKWYAKALTKPPVALSPSRQREYLNQIYESNERMITLVNKLLNASLLETGRTTARPEPVRISMYLKQVLVDLQALIRDREITIVQKTKNEPRYVVVDPVWIRAILQALLSNAIRYSRPGQRVAVSIGQSAHGAVIAVADSGYGIPADQQDKIFTKLYRADNASQIIGEGSGLDLYIAKELVTRIGGAMRFVSKENKGSTFYVQLPLRARSDDKMSAKRVHKKLGSKVLAPEPAAKTPEV